MAKATKRAAALLISVIMALTAVLFIVPPAKASAASLKLAYSVQYGEESATLTLKNSVSGSSIYYTTNGNVPSKSSTRYKSPIKVTKKTLVRAVEYDKSGNRYSSLKITLKVVAASPAIKVAVTGANQTVTLSSTTPGAVIFYTTDGSDPDTTSLRYSKPFTVIAGTQIKAKTYAKNYKASGVSATASALSDAQQVAAIVNSERAKESLAELKLDPDLCTLANVRAKEISQSWGHNRPDGRDCFTVFDDFGYKEVWACGENIAAGQKDAREVMDSWLASPGHRKNILRDYFRSIGVGCYEVNGYKYWVQIFTDGKEVK